MNTKLMTIPFCVLILGSCASTPDISVNYFLPQASYKWTVLQTGMCSAKNIPFVDTKVTLEEKLFERDANSAISLNLKDFDGAFSNGDTGFQFYEDGRLKGFNSSQTGFGQEVVKAALGLAAAAGGGGGASSSAIPVTPALQSACDKIKNELGGKPVTIKYTGTLDSFRSATAAVPPQTSTLAMTKKTYTDSEFDELDEIFGPAPVIEYSVRFATLPCGAGSSTSAGIIHCGTDPKPNDEVRITLRQPAIASVDVEVGRSNNRLNHRFEVPVPQRGQLFTVPVKRPPVFGANRFELGLSESGAITTLKYGKDLGISSSIGTLTDIQSGTDGSSPAEAALEFKAEADLIAAQRRLIICQADPANCI